MAILTPPVKPSPWGQGGSESDLSEEEYRPTRRGGNGGGRGAAIEQAAAVAERLAAAAAERLGAAERLAAKELVAELVAENAAAAQKAAVERAAAAAAAVQKAAVQKLAAEKLAAEKQVAGKSVADEPRENPIPNGEQIGEWLKDVITNHRKGLRKLYGETEEELGKYLKALIEQGEEMARRLINYMGCTAAVAKDLTVLTLYDVAILIDDSGSMISQENGRRKKTLIQHIEHITEICSMANESGILALCFMNDGGGKDNWSEGSQEYLDHHNYGGLTRIGTALKEKILDNFAIGNANQSKPLLVLIVTDGEVEGERKGRLKEVIRDCVKEREGAGKGFDAVRFQFSRIGNDPGAAQLLTDLDQDPDIGEYIDVLPVELDLKGRLANRWSVLRKIFLGAILPEWDEYDDGCPLEAEYDDGRPLEKDDYLADREEDSEEDSDMNDFEDD